METTMVSNFFMSYNHNEEQLEIENNKRVLRSHPLFPVISYLQYEIDHYQNEIGSLQEEHLKIEEKVQGFIREFSQQIRETNATYNPAPEVDGFVLNSIRKLRHDLLELQEVTKFANKFVIKYQNDLERTSEQYGEINEVERDAPSVSSQSSESVHKQEQFQQEQKPTMHNISGQEYPSHLVNEVPPACDQAAGHSNPNPFDMKNSPSSSIEDGRSSVASSTGTTESKKNFSKETIRILESWLHQNLERPYPSEPEKEELAVRCGISKTQVNNWFINVRRRKVPRLLNTENKKNDQMKSTLVDGNNNAPQFPPFPGMFPNPMFQMYPGTPMQNPMGQQMNQFQNMPFPGTPMFPGNGFNPMQFSNMMGGPMANFQMAQMRPPGLQDAPPQNSQPVQSPFQPTESISPYQNQTPPILEQIGNNGPMPTNGQLQMNFPNMPQFYGNQNFQ